MVGHHKGQRDGAPIQMRSLPLALVLSIALWALIVELATRLMTAVDDPYAISVLAELVAVAPALMAAMP